MEFEAEPDQATGAGADWAIALPGEAGKLVELRSTPMAEVADLIRRPVGSKLKLVVMLEGEDSCQTVELTRAPVGSRVVARRIKSGG